jgi:hypothetical protein
MAERTPAAGVVLGVAGEATHIAGAVLGVAAALGVAGRMLLGGGGRGALDGAVGVSSGFGRIGGGGGCWLGRDNGAEPRLGDGGGVAEGRDGSMLVPPFGRGGSDTGLGGCATGLGATTGGSLPIAARFSLSLAVPCSSPMEALCAGPAQHSANCAAAVGQEPTVVCGPGRINAS